LHFPIANSTLDKTPERYSYRGLKFTRYRLRFAHSLNFSEGNVLFCHPLDSRRAIEEGLRIGQEVELMTKKPGEVMGLFAYGHPFLDGNGRTMLLVHLELIYRAGFSITWADTNKAHYLTALSNEIDNPGLGILDTYLLKFKSDRLERNEWGKKILSIKGLDGLDADNQIIGNLTDPVVAEKYRQFVQQRGYSYEHKSNDGEAEESSQDNGLSL
jgi:cell filamentation protein